MSDEPLRQRIKWKLLRLALRGIWNAFAVLGIFTVFYLFCFNVSRITSPSMSPTLEGTNWENGDVVLTEKTSFWFREPNRWEVITIRRADNSLIMKRVVGLPAETIRIPRRGKIEINRIEVTPPPSLSFLNHLPYGNVVVGQEVPCGDGFYVLGDDSEDSDDSRFNGPVDRHNVVGRTWLILSPKSRFGWVNP